MFRLVVHRRAARYLKRLPANRQAEIKSKLKELRERPTALEGIKAMRGEWKGYRRLRVGELRLIFWFDEDSRTIFVDHIGPRGDVYKK